jgi:flagellum-specific peptidoglycan hydrolase FlgJ
MPLLKRARPLFDEIPPPFSATDEPQRPAASAFVPSVSRIARCAKCNSQAACVPAQLTRGAGRAESGWEREICADDGRTSYNRVCIMSFKQSWKGPVVETNSRPNTSTVWPRQKTKFRAYSSAKANHDRFMRLLPDQQPTLR